MSKLIEIIEWANRQFDVIARWSLVVTMLILLANIFFRAIGVQFLGAYEWVGLVLVLVNGFALAYCTDKEGHVSIDLLTEKLPTGAKKALDIIINLVNTIFLFFLFMQMFKYAGSLAKTGEVSLTSQIPMYPFVYALSAGFFLFSLSFLVKLLKAFSVKEAAGVNADNHNQISS